jgi:hypothetical protein
MLDQRHACGSNRGKLKFDILVDSGMVCVREMVDAKGSVWCITCCCCSIAATKQCVIVPQIGGRLGMHVPSRQPSGQLSCRSCIDWHDSWGKIVSLQNLRVWRWLGYLWYAPMPPPPSGGTSTLA